MIPEELTNDDFWENADDSAKLLRNCLIKAFNVLADHGKFLNDLQKRLDEDRH
jgi:hypothetical protein